MPACARCNGPSRWRASGRRCCTGCTSKSAGSPPERTGRDPSDDAPFVVISVKSSKWLLPPSISLSSGKTHCAIATGRGWRGRLPTCRPRPVQTGQEHTGVDPALLAKTILSSNSTPRPQTEQPQWIASLWRGSGPLNGHRGVSRGASLNPSAKSEVSEILV